MEGIFKDGNVYVYIENDQDITDSIRNSDTFIIGTKKHVNHLYGGRVKIKYCESYGYIEYNELLIHIDGIEIRKIDENANFCDHCTPSEITAYLNQIENLGIDSFLENYKQQIQQLKLEATAYAEKLQQELALNYDETRAKTLSSYNDLIHTLGCIIISLFINMNAGLDNQCYLNAYENIINSYF